MLQVLVENMVSKRIGTKFKGNIPLLQPYNLCISNYRMDKSAVGHDYIAKVEKHESQTDHSKGFGGKFGVQKDRVDRVSFRI